MPRPFICASNASPPSASNRCSQREETVGVEPWRKAREANESLDPDRLYVKLAIINEGPKLKRFMPAAMGRGTPIHKRTSHVEIVVAEKEGGGR